MPETSRDAASNDRPFDAGRHVGDDMARWPDARLVDAVRGDPPDADALDTLVRRHWRALHARCGLLALDREAAGDLAQETWVRVLRARGTLDPDASFRGYLVTIATNLWRDRNRAARRAGVLADDRLASLDAAIIGSDGDSMPLAHAIADPESLAREDRALLALDVDRALATLSPRARDVLVARWIDGDSAAEIGRRYGRTEQTVTAWLRHAAEELRRQLGPRYETAAGETHVDERG